ncbi:MAG: PBP1A family penicillin-binding protein [Patescibacteria group bacterium]
MSPKFHRGKGRPRTTPFLKFYLRKINKNLYSKIPGKTKVSIAALSILLAIYFYTNWVVHISVQLPSPKTLSYQSSPLTTEVYDRGGNLLYRFYEGQNRSLVKLKDLPAILIKATISAEDKNFYSHIGFDPTAILRASYHNLTQSTQEGASTITQQLIKNSLLTPEKTITRKIKEIILAFWAERIFSKDQILEMYFNGAPYGGTAWGIEAASLTYFGKSSRELTLPEASFLAGLPASPTEFSPFGIKPELGKQRQAWVLNRMVKDGFITKEEAEEALGAKLALRPQSNNISAPHFVFYVRDLLSKQLGSKVISTGGLKITTTLDLELQSQVEKIVKEEVEALASLNVRNGAAMVTDPKTGHILAMVGSRDYHYPLFGNYNATLALRQPGSSIKVVTYATAFKQGYTPGNTVLDTPVVFKDEWGNRYGPVNYDGSFHGPVSIRQALGSSYNVPAVKMLAAVGLDAMIQTAKDMGITTFNDPKRYGLSLTLGGGEVKMVDMMAVYGTLSQEGFLRRPTPILKVTDSYGNVLDEYQDRKIQSLRPEIAYLLTSILSDNLARTPAFGPSSLLNIPGYQLAVKTGTSDNKRDNWTFGYTPQFVVGVWVGNNDNSLMHPSLTSGVTGAAPIWNKITKYMIQKNPPTAFKRPEGIVEARIDGRRDLAISDVLPKGLTKVRKDGEKTIFSDSFSSYATSSAQAPIQSGQAATKNTITN